TTAQAQWRSAAHMGFAVDSSQTGFNKVGGSTVFLDVERSLDSFWALGLRTIAGGGHQDGADFYRLITGPLLSLAPTKSWLFQLSAGIYSESAKADSDEGYHARGHAVQLGWSRIFAISSKTS